MFVPGNHDVDLSGYTSSRGLWTTAGVPTDWPGPTGAVNVDCRVADVDGLRIAGLGGSIHYNGGPNQWAERQMARRATSATGRTRRTEASPACTRLLRELRPTVMPHGHIHPHGEPVPDRVVGDTRVINTVGYRILDIPAPTDKP
ncbi:probable phosphoesterase [Alloactinosynnema sp. L-07]|nr:probable phosphoesterase [Alloactinosynnema sp. L-07]